MISITEHEDGLVLPVRAQPGARRNTIQGEHDGMLKVAVTQAPEAGKANQAISTLLARELGIAKSHVVLMAGKTNRHKKFLIRGVSASDLERWLREVASQS